MTDDTADQQPSPEVARLRDEVGRLHAELEAERTHAAQWREVAEDRRVTLERFRQHPAVRLVFWIASLLLPPLRRARRRVEKIQRRARKVAAGAAGVPHRLTAPRRQRQLESAVAGLSAPPADDRLVSVIILTHDGVDNLVRLLPALRARTHHEAREIIIVDNASGSATRAFLDAQAADNDDVTIIRNDTNRSFAAANNQAAAAARGDVLCFCNDDLEPLSEGWLDRMLAHLDGQDVAAVGAHLVYPRRPLLATTRTRDLGIQHLGIEFVPTPGGVPRARNITSSNITAGDSGFGAADEQSASRTDEPDPDRGRDAVETAAATAACLAVDREAFEEVGGFDEAYDYGAEDVDLCWRLRRHGRRIGVATDAVLYHHEGATRWRVADPRTLNDRQRRNWDRFAGRFGPEVTRAVALDRLSGAHRLSRRPYEVAVTITRDLPEAGYGDWQVAHELGDELGGFGWRVRYVERYRDAWYDLSEDVDAVVCLLDSFDVRKVARPGLTTIAWVRNWAERWASMPWFDDYDLVLASSHAAAELLADRTRHEPVVFPLATNPDSFSPAPGGPERETPDWRDPGPVWQAGAASESEQRVVFTGNYWGRDTRLDDLVAAVDDLEVYGKGWEEVDGVGPAWKGALDYDQLPDLYRDALLVVDQAAEHTKAQGSLNARVFDALAAGTLVVTNQRQGARELFAGRLPTFETPAELADVVRGVRRDPAAAARLAGELRDEVLGSHTYAARAGQLRDLLVERVRRASFVLKTSAPDRATADTWGDWHLAEALARELRAAGHDTRLQTADEWDQTDGCADDVAVHLKGRSVAPRVDGQVHVVWNISHPEELTVEECDAADLVLVASTTFPDELSRRTSTPVDSLLQATDEHRFFPTTPDPAHGHEVAFVGNSRYALRPVVRDAVAADLSPAVYGANWDKYVDPDLVVATFVPNDQLAGVYSSVDVLLNDHWEGMRAHGFVSNRVFDALACGATVVSDDLPELSELFGDAVAVYDGTPEDLRRVVSELLADTDRRRDMGARGRDIVLAEHTFAHRARQLIEAVVDLVAERRQWPTPGSGARATAEVDT